MFGFRAIGKYFSPRLNSEMEKIYSLPFSVLEVPNLKIKKPTWLHQPSAMTVFAVILLSYFMVTGGMHTSFPVYLNVILSFCNEFTSIYKESFMMSSLNPLPSALLPTNAAIRVP